MDGFVFISHSSADKSLAEMICRSMLGEYGKAEEHLEAALEINLLRNGRKSLQTMRTREAIADNTLRGGNVPLAKKQYAQLEMDMETDFGENSPRLLALREKTAAL